jgi:hypothetical protein
MKLRGLFQVVGYSVAALCLAGCATAPRKISSVETHLIVGQKYVLKRDAILLERRGLIESLENPAHSFDNYKPYRDYDPYYVRPIAVLPAGTLLQVKKIRAFKGESFDVEGEILSDKYKHQSPSTYDVAKGLTVGGWPPTGKVMMENLCGGSAFDPAQLQRNLSEKVD